jgi:hypothetical protein
MADEVAFAALRRAWEACTQAERVRFLRELRAEQTAAKQATRADKDKALAEKIRLGNERHGYVDPPAGEPGQIVGWMSGLPIRR